MAGLVHAGIGKAANKSRSNKTPRAKWKPGCHWPPKGNVPAVVCQARRSQRMHKKVVHLSCAEKGRLRGS